DQNIDLPQLRDDLFRLVSLPCHCSPPGCQRHTSSRTTSMGVNQSAARNEALAVIRDLANPKIGGGSPRWASWFLELADDRGRFFRMPIGQPALEVVTPDGLERRGEEPVSIRPVVTALAPDAAQVRARTAAIVQEMWARQADTVRLLKVNH